MSDGMGRILRRLPQHKLAMLRKHPAQRGGQIVLQRLQVAIHRHILRVGLRGLTAVQRHELAGDLNIVDFSSRHFKRHVEDIAGRAAGPESIVVGWKLPEPPAYIWTTKKPDWYTVQAEEQPTNTLMDNSGHFRPLMRLVIQCWKA